MVVKGPTGLGQLALEGENVVFNSQEGGRSPWPCSTQACCGTSGTQVFPLSEVVGATADDTAVRIWHCERTRSGSGAGAKVHFKLHKSPAYECSSREAARAFVSEVQRVASWRGKDTPPRVVAVVNPHSGRGKGCTIFNEQVLPLLRDAAGMSVEVHMTQSARHATQLVNQLPLGQVDLLLYVGGDGTVYEGMQGLFTRPDWAAAARVPFTTVPTGSGNGLAASLGVFDPLSAAFCAVKGRAQPMDVASVLQPPSSRYFLVLSLTYGLMANLDIGTENLRWMGEARFSYGGLREILGGAFYPLRAAFWPAGTAPPEAQAHGLDAGSVVLQGGQAQADDASALLLGKGAGKSSSPAVSPVHGNQPGPSSAGTAISSMPPGPPLPILSQLGRLPASLPPHVSQLPEGWKMLPESVGSQAQYFMLHNTQYLALNARMNPKGVLSDGAWELIHMSGLAGAGGKLKGLDVLLKSETGAHVELDYVHTERVRALMLEPLAGDTTWTVLDGEAVPSTPLFLEVHEKACCVLVPPGWMDEPYGS